MVDMVVVCNVGEGGTIVVSIIHHQKEEWLH